MRLFRLFSIIALVLGFITMSTGNDAVAQDLENTLYLDLKRPPDQLSDLAPNHVARIKELTREGFYDGLNFHRVIEGFMAQTGDPRGDSTGSSARNFQRVFERESCAVRFRWHVRQRRDSQFFIVFADAPHLDGQYTIWGQVTEGMEYVDMIKKGAPWANGSVADPDQIVKMQVAADAQ